MRKVYVFIVKINEIRPIQTYPELHHISFYFFPKKQYKNYQFSSMLTGLIICI